MKTKEYVYRLQHHGMSRSELIGAWVGMLGLGYLIVRSLITFA